MNKINSALFSTYLTTALTTLLLCLPPGAGLKAAVSTFKVDPVSFSAAAPANPGNLAAGDNNPADADFTYFRDIDGDGYGDPQNTIEDPSPAPPDGYVANDYDCNDSNPSINPSAVETCNLIDDNCNGLADDNDPAVTGQLDFYFDGDGDGYGAGAMQKACIPPAASAIVDGDCNDQDPYIKPGAAEVCDYGVDNDCNSVSDDNDPGVIGQYEFYPDTDMDGFGAGNAQPTLSCSNPPGMAYADASDCDDDDPLINPFMQEVCDGGIDNNCNQLVDDEDSDVLGQQTWYADSDGDEYGDASASKDACVQPAGYVGDATDCDDTDAAVKPGGVEVCNSVDDDCNTTVDDNVPLPLAGAISGMAALCSSTSGTGGFEVPGDPFATTYVWTLPAGLTIESGDGTSSIQVKWTATAIVKGIIGEVAVFAKNSCSNGPVSTLKIDYNYTTPVRPGTPQGPARLCPGETAVYSVPQVARTSIYEWSCPQGLTILSGQGTPSVTVTMDNTFTGGAIGVKAGNACGWSPLRTRVITLNIPSIPPAVTGPVSGLCGSTGVQYTTAGISGITQYLWTVPAGAVITGGQGSTTIKVDFSGGFGGGSLTVRAVNGCGQGGARSLTLMGKPGNPGPITGDSTICPSAQGVVYGVNTVAGAATYNWTAPAGATVSTGQGTNTITVNFGTSTYATNLTIYVRASNACGESGLRVKGGISIDAMHCVAPRLQQPTGEVEGFNVYPNPARDRVTVECLAAGEGEAVVTFLSPDGRVVIREIRRVEAGPNAFTVSTGQLRGGVYIVTLQTGDTPPSLMRLMVE